MMLAIVALAHGPAAWAERELIHMEAAALPPGQLAAEKNRADLPLRAPTLVRHGQSPGVFVQAAERPQIVFEKTTQSDEVALQFEWPEAASPPGVFTLVMRLQPKAVSKGGNLNVVFRSMDRQRALPRLQITNGGSLSLVASPEEVYRLKESLPQDRVTELKVVVDYRTQKISLLLDGRPSGEPVAFAPSAQPVTHLSFSTSEADRARWTAFEEITAFETQ